MDAINAALNPEQTDYFYFATDKAGKYYYAKTLAAHQELERDQKSKCSSDNSRTGKYKCG